MYTNHVAPDVAGFRFGMAKRCHGPGEPLAARDLITAYATARATGDREPFAFPRATDRCDEPGDVFGVLQIVGDDPPPLPREDCAQPSTPNEAPSRSAELFPSPSSSREVQCRRRTVLEEYEDDVEVIGPDGKTLGGVGVPRAASLDLVERLRGACARRQGDMRARGGAGSDRGASTSRRP